MLNEQLLQERLRNFKPAPLIEYVGDEKKEDIEIPMIVEDANNIDLAKANYLNMLDDDEIKKISEDTIRKYGVGTCGPRAFYGKPDRSIVHHHSYKQYRLLFNLIFRYD